MGKPDLAERLAFPSLGILLLLIASGYSLLNEAALAEYGEPWGMKDAQNYHARFLNPSLTELGGGRLSYYIGVQSFAKIVGMDIAAPLLIFIFIPIGLLCLTAVIYPGMKKKHLIMAPLFVLAGTMMFSTFTVVGLWSQAMHTFILLFGLAYLIKAAESKRHVLSGGFLIVIVSTFTHQAGNILLAATLALLAIAYPRRNVEFVILLVAALVLQAGFYEVGAYLHSYLFYKTTGAIATNLGGGPDHPGPIESIFTFVNPALLAMVVAFRDRRLALKPTLAICIIAICLLGCFFVAEGRTALSAIPFISVLAARSWEKASESSSIRSRVLMVAFASFFFFLFSCSYLIALNRLWTSAALEKGYVAEVLPW